jgi:hypothetical protein
VSADEADPFGVRIARVHEQRAAEPTRKRQPRENAMGDEVGALVEEDDLARAWRRGLGGRGGAQADLSSAGQGGRHRVTSDGDPRLALVVERVAQERGAGAPG